MRSRDVKPLIGHALTNGGHLWGWSCWPFVQVEHGLFFENLPVWRVYHSSCCALRDKKIRQ